MEPDPNLIPRARAIPEVEAVLRRVFRPKLFAVRLVAVLVMLGAVVFDTGWLVGLAIVPMLVQALTHAGVVGVMLRSFRDTPCLAEGRLPDAPDADLPPVTAIVPARNEEAAIEVGLRSILSLNYPRLQVVAVDDHSTDSTPAILDKLKSEYPRLSVLANPPLQEGWLGKANAVWNAARLTDESCTWLLLTDADTVYEPNALRLAVAHAEANRIDLLSCVPWLDNHSLAEQLVMPLAWSGLIAGAHPTRVNRPKATPIGVGAFILVRRAAYFGSGGHSAFYAQQPEDCLLAATVRHSGGTLGAIWTPGMVRVRIYRGYREMRDVLTRKTRMSSDDHLGELFSRGLYALIQEILPSLVFAGGCVRLAVGTDHPIAWGVLVFVSLAAYLFHVAGCTLHRRFARIRRGLAWIHPVGCSIRLWILSRAIAQAVTGKKMEWRGREFKNVRLEKPGPAG